MLSGALGAAKGLCFMKSWNDVPGVAVDESGEKLLLGRFANMSLGGIEELWVSLFG